VSSSNIDSCGAVRTYSLAGAPSHRASGRFVIRDENDDLFVERSGVRDSSFAKEFLR